MLEVCVKTLESFLMMVYGFLVIKKITKSEIRINNTESIVLIVLGTMLGTVLHKDQYNSLFTISIFALNILIYKMIFKIKIEESLVICGIMMLLLFAGDLVCSTFISIFTTIEEARKNIPLYLVSTIIICIVGYSLLFIKPLLEKLQMFYLNFSKKTVVTTMMFLTLLIIGLSSIAQNIFNAFIFEPKHVANTIIMIIFIILSYLFIKSKNNYSELSQNYDNLFTYVQNFEDWIEKEQLNRHEYKNQLAVIRCLTKEKKVKDKIDEILEDNINIEGNVVSKLKFLPKGGIKGLVYYKAAIAQKEKINLTVDVDLETNSILNRLSEQDVRVLCKLIGIYFDNAIEAAVETRKKSVLLEVYEIKDKVTIVLSNTFKKHDNFKDRNKKGVSSKGEGHGNGLYFASKLVASNKWLESKQEVIDNYYIQQLIIYDRKKNEN